MSNEFTSYIDTAQVTLYLFWFFFAGLVWWLRREDRREGYPLESDNPRYIRPENNFFIPAPKVFIRPDGVPYPAPNYERDERPMQARRTSEAAGSAWDPIGDPLTAGVGPATWVDREDKPDATRHGEDLIVPTRVAKAFYVNGGPDPRGWPVMAADGELAGTVKDLWVDRADIMVRYLEVELAAGDPTPRLVPMPSCLLRKATQRVEVSALKATQFVHIPTLKEPNRVTLREEEKIMALFAGGFLYSDHKRLGPVV